MPNQGAAWLRSAGKTVCPEAARVADLVDWWLHGIYHEQDAMLRTDWTNSLYVAVKITGESFATTDFDDLTRLVVGAHDAAIRVSIECRGMKTMQLLFHPRTREGSRSHSHPTIEAALAGMVRFQPSES